MTLHTVQSKLAGWWATLSERLSQGKTPYIVILVYLVVGTALVYVSPRSLVAFLIFLSSAFFIYRVKMDNRFRIVLGIIMALVLIPILGVRNISYLEVIFQISVYAALALGLNIVVGFAGLLDLGYVAFYAVGAYLWAIFGSRQMFMLHMIPGTAPATTAFFLPANMFYVFVILGVGVAALTGILLGLPVLRLRGDYLAIVTLGFGEVIRVLANNLDKPINLTNGPQGITPIQQPVLPESVLNVLRVVMNPVVGHRVTTPEFYNLFFYLAALVMILVVILVVRRIDDSNIGRAWTAIREDEDAAIAMGVPLVRMKLMAFAAGASFAGAMGMIFAAKQTFVNPDSFTFMESIGVLAMVILGGMGSIPGAILGATIVTVLNLQILTEISLKLSELRQSGGMIPLLNIPWVQFPNQLEPAKYQRMVFGIVLVVMMIFRPQGLLSVRRRRMEIEEALHPEEAAGEIAPVSEEK